MNNNLHMLSSKSSSSSSPPSQRISLLLQGEQNKNVIATEAEIVVPGSFVVLQGNAGDGLSNTVDRCMTWLPQSSSSDDDNDNDDDDLEELRRPASASSEEFHHVQNVVCVEEVAQHQQQQRTTATHPTLGQLLTTSSTMGLSGLAARSSSLSQHQQKRGGDDSYIVVTDDQHKHKQKQQSSSSTPSITSPARRRARPTTTATTTAADARAVEEWKVECRNHEVQKRNDWKDSLGDQIQQQLQQQTSVDALLLEHTMMRTTITTSTTDEGEEWWQSDGRLAIFRELPTKLHGSGVILKSVIGTLSPGATIVATDIVYLNSATLGRMTVPPTTTSSSSTASPHTIFPRGRVGWIQLVKLDHVSGRTGYAVLSLDGYPLMAPGLPSLYVDPYVWVWRVTCPAGAYVREGLDLNTQHTDTLPYGSLIRVTRRTLNAQGLSRLRVHALLLDENDSNDPYNDDDQNYYPKQVKPKQLQPRRRRVVDGWCSEFLNPLSGQRGIVAQPLPFPVPALYRVTLSLGAVIRSDIELSSPQIGLAPMGAILKIVARAFSEHPVDKCIERLQLAGNGGWISVRLNRPPPLDDLIVEFVGIDSLFDPDQPGTYHMEALRAVEASQEPPSSQPVSPSRGIGDISSVDEDSSSGSTSDTHPLDTANANNANNPPIIATTYHTRNKSKSSAAANMNWRHGPDAGRCLICLNEERNATIVHGETGHVACCLVCARILKARGDKCPVCRLEIDMVIQHFWA